jgi:hypothetical protein
LFFGGHMSEITHNELTYPFNLNCQQRGHLAELAFMRKAASLGFSVAKPWAEGERYDAIVRVENVCWRVQVKSTLAKAPSRPHYRIKTSTCSRYNQHDRTLYSANDIDFLVAYIFPEDLWYVFPVAVIENRAVVALMPGSRRSRFEQYREAWNLFRVKDAGPGITASDAPAIALADDAALRADARGGNAGRDGSVTRICVPPWDTNSPAITHALQVCFQE